LRIRTYSLKKISSPTTLVGAIPPWLPLMLEKENLERWNVFIAKARWKEEQLHLAFTVMAITSTGMPFQLGFVLNVANPILKPARWISFKIPYRFWIEKLQPLKKRLFPNSRGERPFAPTGFGCGDRDFV